MWIPILGTTSLRFVGRIATEPRMALHSHGRLYPNSGNRESVEHVLYRHPQEARTPKAPNPETQQLCARHPDLNPSSEAPTARFMILCPFLIYTSPLHQSQCFTNILSICLCSPATRQAGPAQGGVWKFGDTVSGSYNRGSETFLSGSRDSVSMPGNHSVVFRVQGK